MRGASPRLRGKLDPLHHLLLDGRCIPAPAGETRPRCSSGRPTRVHPRACGGNGRLRRTTRPAHGASPRLRGKRRGPPGGRSRPGCIPAPAGETAPGPSWPSGPSVHPRACGGNPSPPCSWRYMLGASPRLRGKPLDGRVGGGEGRCIPAPAGETLLTSTARCLREVHPRACGGNVLDSLDLPFAEGASPRLRGKQNRFPTCRMVSGCIPAPAGETVNPEGSDFGPRVHPRACGGNGSQGRSKSGNRGASPRLRGKRAPYRAPTRPRRCIPAPAGETGLLKPCRVSIRVHPRACGGNGCRALHILWRAGASPRLRGKPRRQDQPPP